MKPPVLVIGQGPAGTSTALWLARLGLPVLGIDRQSRQGLHIGESLPPDAADLLKEMGLWSRFAGADHEKCYGNRSYWFSDHAAFHDFLKHPLGHGWHIDRAGFEAMLHEACQQAGVVQNLQAEVVSLDYDGSLWQVGIKTEQGLSQGTYSFLVDATGRNGWLARSLGVERLYEARQLAMVAFLEGTLEDSTSLVETASGGWWYSAKIPHGKVATAFFFPAESGARPKVTGDDWWDHLQAAPHTSARLPRDGFRLCQPPRLVSAHSGIQEQVCGPGWLAVGDAAMTYDPISAHGLMNSMLSGRDGAKAIAETLAGNEEALPAYGHRLFTAFMAYSKLRGRYYPEPQAWPEEIPVT